jgi:hypothetical protein
MTKDEALDLALEALEYIHEGANNQGPHTGISWRCVAVKAEPAIKAIKQARALDKKAENARELGLDYEPVWDNLPSSKDVEDAMRIKRLNQLATPPAQPAPVQEPVFELQESGWEIICDLDWIQTLPFGTKLYTTPPAAQPASVPTSWMEMVTGNLLRKGVNKHTARELAEHFYRLHPFAAQPAPVPEPDHGDELTIAYMSGVQRGKELAAQRQWTGLTDEEIAELRRLHEENERLAGEVANRNRRALDGDEAVAALSNVHAYYEKLERVNAQLVAALNAMLTHMGMDEDEWNKPTFDKARAAIAKATGGAV